jgi:hypothetical protein
MKNLKIKFGEVNDDGNEAQIKEVVTKAFGELENIGPYDKLYVAMPHANEYTKFLPSGKSKDQLELYIFATPTIAKAKEIAGQNKTLKFGSNEYKLEIGQMDKVSALLDLTFNEMVDDNKNQFAIRKDNKIFVLQDLFHPTLKEDVVVNILQEMALFISNAPKSEPKEKLEKIVAEMVLGLSKEELKELEAQRKNADRKVLDNQNIYLLAIQESADIQRKISKFQSDPEGPAMDMAKRFVGMDVIEKLIKTTFGVQVLTKDICVGPFNFGPWIVDIGNGVNLEHAIKPAEIIGTATVKAKHPHDRTDRQGEYRICVGGFGDEIIRSQKFGEWDRTLTYWIHWIINYDGSDGEISTLLKGVMGDKEFKEALLKVAAPEITEDICKDIRISSIKGADVSITGTRKDNGQMVKKEVFLS